MAEVEILKVFAALVGCSGRIIFHFAIYICLFVFTFFEKKNNFSHFYISYMSYFSTICTFFYICTFLHCYILTFLHFDIFHVFSIFHVFAFLHLLHVKMFTVVETFEISDILFIVTIFSKKKKHNF